MSRRNLRQKPRISYYEPEEPPLDEYIFCTECKDYVYEYCSIHGPLLVVLDDEVPKETGMPACVPRSALTIPSQFLHLARSIIPGAGIGVFSTLTLPRGVRFGPYRGKRSNTVDSSYCWQIYSTSGSSAPRPSHVVDAADAGISNWMRFVNCARHWHEQNLVAFQYRGELYYRTIKIVPRFTELLVFYGSEAAIELGIDLSRYNSPQGYAYKLGSLLPQKRIQELSTASKPTKHELQKETDNISAKQNNNTTSVEKKKRRNKKKTGTKNNEDSISSTNVKLKKPRGKKFNPPVTKNEKNCDTVSKIDVTKTTESITTCSINNIDETTQVFGKVTINNPLDDESTKKDKCVTVYKISVDHKQSVNAPLIQNNNLNEKSCENCVGINTQNDVYKYSNECSSYSDRENRKFVYEICCDSFNSSSNLSTHKKKHRNEKVQLNFNTSNNSDGKEIFACNYCFYQFDAKSSLIDHMRIHTKEKSFACNVCSFQSTHKTSLNTHMRTHTGDKIYAFNVCSYRFTEKSTLKRHMRTHTGEKPFACNICSYRCNQQTHLKSHMRTHTGEKPFACDVCSYRCNQKISLKSHMRTHTGEKPFACNICSYRCNQQTYLKSHMRTHTGEKPFACDVCSYRCNHKIYLKSHMRTHTGEKPFACNICSYRCNQQTDLKRHMRTHTGEKPFACDVCSYRFTEKSILKRHMRTHTGEKPFACNICSYRCNQQTHLKSHMRTHTGEKPFACDVCSYRCNKNNNLKRHMRTHTGEKPFACDVCSYRCNQKIYLKSHMRTHTGEKPFACNICSYRCNRKDTLKVHIYDHTPAQNLGI